MYNINDSSTVLLEQIRVNPLHWWELDYIDRATLKCFLQKKYKNQMHGHRSNWKARVMGKLLDQSWRQNCSPDKKLNTNITLLILCAFYICCTFHRICWYKIEKYMY
jgi:hypothetical protein